MRHRKISLCCYVKICQLFSKLSGGIFQCWIAAIWGSVQVYMGARLMTHSILYQVAFRALMIHLPSWWSGQKFEEIWEFILLASSIWSIWPKRGNSNVALWANVISGCDPLIHLNCTVIRDCCRPLIESNRHHYRLGIGSQHEIRFLHSTIYIIVGKAQ